MYSWREYTSHPTFGEVGAEDKRAKAAQGTKQVVKRGRDLSAPLSGSMTPLASKEWRSNSHSDWSKEPVLQGDHQEELEAVLAAAQCSVIAGLPTCSHPARSGCRSDNQRPKG